MKNFKISFVAILAIVIGMGLSSFTLFQKPSSKKWFTLSGPDRTMATSYEEAPNDGENPQCPTIPAAVCAIYANEGDPGYPLQTELDVIRDESEEFTEEQVDLQYHE